MRTRVVKFHLRMCGHGWYQITRGSECLPVEERISVIERPLRLLFVHQGFELYGSDRTFLQSIQAARKRFPGARITVVLPRSGPLSARAEQFADEVHTMDLAVLRKSDLKQLKFSVGWEWASAIERARGLIQQHDLTYINSVVVFDFVTATRLTSRPALLHVHELPVGVGRYPLAGLARWAKATRVFNSGATQRAFMSPGIVVHNGTANQPYVERAQEEELRVLMPGRLNAFKGQGLLLEALAQLTPNERRRLRVRIVGDYFGTQEHFRTSLLQKREALGLSGTVSLEPFVEDPGELYRWADVVTMPSTDPEPFGLVAIEAMAHGRAVIAADHGGLTEIVVQDLTGLRFAPRNAAALAACLRLYLVNSEIVTAHGRAGRERQQAHFSEEQYLNGIANAIQGALDR